VHEVVIAPETLSKSDPAYQVFAHHTTPEQAAEVFNKVQPKVAAYSHIVFLHGMDEKELSKRTNYKGPLVIGEHLMSFSIDETVAISHWSNK
jgi:ribonuclease Z